MRQQLTVQDLGLIPYADALRIQQQKSEELTDHKLKGISNGHSHFLFLCEHTPVITLGKSGDEHHLLMDENFLREKGIEFYRTSRGGDITYHGPGQIVGYPVMDLEFFFTDIKRYMRMLEEVIIQTIAEFGLKGYRIDDATGVWVNSISNDPPKKIAAFGVKMSRWVTMHGFALNVDPDLSHFEYIVPCGIADKGVTSMRNEIGNNEQLSMDKVKEIVLDKFSAIFDVEINTHKLINS